MSIRYKNLLLLIVFCLSTACAMAWFVGQALVEDKRLAVMDLHTSTLNAVTSELKVQVKARLDDFEVILPRLYRSPAGVDAKELFAEASRELPLELVSASIYRVEGDNLVPHREFINAELLAKKKLPADFPSRLNVANKLPAPADKQPLQLVNRSLLVPEADPKHVPVLTFVMDGTSVAEPKTKLLVAVDILTEQFRRRLYKSELAEVFLAQPDGAVLFHPSAETMANHVAKPLDHPIVPRLKGKAFPRESLDVRVAGTRYYVNSMETGFPDVIAVAQTRHDELLATAIHLAERVGLVVALVLSTALIVSLLLGARLGYRVKRLIKGIESLGKGERQVRFDARSRDEIGAIGKQLQWLSGKLDSIVAAAVKQAEAEADGKHASLLKATVLSPAPVESPAIEVAHSSPDLSEVRNNTLWEVRVGQRYLSVLMADAGSDSVPAALVLAMARASFAAAHADPAGFPGPDQFLNTLNGTLYSICRGKLSLAASIVRLDLETGELWCATAGHRGPLCLRMARSQAEDFSQNGPLLGARAVASLRSTKHQVELKDVLLFHSPGLTAAVNGDGKIWGDGGLTQSLLQGKGSNVTALRDRLERAFRDHIADAPLTEDASFLLIHWKRRWSEFNKSAEDDSEKSLWEFEPEKKVAEQAPSLDLDAEAAEREAFLFEGKDWDTDTDKGGSGSTPAAA